MVFKQTKKTVEPKTCMALSISPDTNEQDHNERQVARFSRNKPSLVLRPKILTQHATSDRITFDF